MDIKQLLEKMDQFAGQAVGQKPGDQVRGTEKAKPTKSGKDHPFKGRLVGGGAEQQEESILKDLSKGPKAKSKEQELAEEYQAFLEAEFKDTVEKRPGRKGSRPVRGHEPLPRYKTIKADEGLGQSHYKWEITFKNGKKAAYHHDSPHYSDATAASDIRSTLKSNPGATVVATKDGKTFDWESLLSEEYDTRDAYELEDPKHPDFHKNYEEYKEKHPDAKLADFIAHLRSRKNKTNEDGYYGPVEARWMVELSDDEGTHLKTYVDKFPSLSAAKKAYKNTPYASNFKYTPVKKDTNEAVDSDIVQAMGQDAFNRAGYNPIRDERDYLDKLSQLKNLERKPGLNQAMKDHIIQRVRDLNAEAFKKGYIKAESRGHKIVANKLKDVERAKKFASGEFKIPTPQERQAQLKQLEKEPKQVKEYGATSTGSPTSTSTDDVKKAMAATSTLKAATGTSQPAPLLMKAMDTISQGKTASATDMQVAQNTLQDINTAFKEPDLANQLKPILAKANQLQQKK